MSDSSSETGLDNEAPVAPAASTPAPVVSPAEPTPAKPPESALDAVQRALRPDPGVDAGAPTAEPRSPQGEVDPNKPPAPDPSELSDEEKRTFSEKAQQRIRELAAQKNEARTALENFTKSPEQIELKDKAERHDQLSGFLTRNGITSQEANNSLELTRLIKAGDFRTAYDLMKPIYSELEKRAGEVLDPDLHNDVRLGHVPVERAQELQRLRASASIQETRQQVAENRQSEQQQSEASKQFVATIAKGADDWAKTKALSDPDWDKKQDQIAEIVELDLRRNGFPKTVAETIQRSEKALEEVNRRWKTLRPGPVEIRPNLGNGRPSARSDAAPKSALEAIEQALG